MVFVGFFGQGEKILPFKVAWGDDFARSLKIRMGQVHAIVGDGDHDRSHPSRNIPSLLCKDMGATGQFLPTRMI